MPDNSIDAVVTDPPYGLSDHTPNEVAACLLAWAQGQPYRPAARKVGFMGKAWDAWVPGPELWKEVLRVLKPGGHALVFAGTRSMDLMGMALRLAGFELRDAIGHAHAQEETDSAEAPLMAWVHGQGFPKSRNVSADLRKQGADGERAAAAWEGWGTALKPAWEPILVCRKPLAESTIANNLQRFGVGALNIEACRVPVDAQGADAGQLRVMRRNLRDTNDGWGMSTKEEYCAQVVLEEGRWPANVVHDGSEDVLSRFPESAGQLGNLKSRGGDKSRNTYGEFRGGNEQFAARGDTGSAARFFYCARPTRAEKDAGLESFEESCTDVLARHRSRRMDEVKRPDGARPATGRNTHPTVKPVALCRYLIRLVTPPGGTVLDPFAGSGTSGVAAINEGNSFIGMENDPESVAIARARCAHAIKGSR
jgi:site-specific DNA-methyltransferase (adenine-specific)